MTLFAGPEAADYVKSVDFITVDSCTGYCMGSFSGGTAIYGCVDRYWAVPFMALVPRELHTFPLTDEADMRKSTIISMFHNQLWENVVGIFKAS